MRNKIGLEKGESTTIAWIKHIHNKTDPDWLANVVFLDYKIVFLDHEGKSESKKDENIINKTFELQRRTAQGSTSKLNDSDVKLWIIVDAENDEEGERKAAEIASTLKEVGLGDQYDLIVYGPKAFVTCYKLKANINCDSESEESSQVDSVEATTSVQGRYVATKDLESTSSSVNASINSFGRVVPLGDNKLGRTEVSIDLAPRKEVQDTGSSRTQFVARSGTDDQKKPPQTQSENEFAWLSFLTRVFSFNQSGLRFASWLYSAGFSTTLTRFVSGLTRNNESDPAQSEPTFIERVKSILLFAFGFDGFNPVNWMITSADGNTKPYTSTRLPFWLILASFLGLPSRAESVIDGVPQFSGWQLLRNLFGVWVPVKETLSNQEGSLSFYQKRWTEKKIVQTLLIFFKLAIIFPIKLFLMPFKIILNIVKLVTEVLLPLITFYTAEFNAALLRSLIRFTFKQTKNNFLRAALIFIGMIPVVAMAIIQYAMVWVCRIVLAMTSPEKSALEAFKLGHRLIIRKEGSTLRVFISNFMGGLGAILSLAFSVLFWTFTLPLAVGALVTAFPSLLGVVTWASQLPIVTSSLTWLSQWSLLTNFAVLVNGAMGTLSAGLTLALGPAITTLATALTVKIPAAVMAVGIFIGVVVIPFASFLSWVADNLSNLWASWIEQKPFASFGRWVSSFSKENKSTKSLGPLPTPETVFVYQAVAGKELIVSDRLLHLKNENNKILEAIEVSEDKAEALYLRAKENKDYNLIHEGARFPTKEEYAAEVDTPATVR